MTPERSSCLLLLAAWTTTPGGRYRSQSTWSGEEYRDEVLLPALQEYDDVTIDLDGISSITTSFVDEAFGGAVRFLGSAAAARLGFICHDLPHRAEKCTRFVAENSEWALQQEASAIDVDRLLQVLRDSALSWSTEAQLQAAIGRLLVGAGVRFNREAEIGPHDRIDFLVPYGIGIEIKTQGSPSSVAEQVMRYCRSCDVRSIVVATSRHRVASLLAPEINGRRVYVVGLWRGGL